MAAAGLEMRLESGPGTLAGATFESAGLARAADAPTGAWRAELRQLAHPATGPLGSLTATCDAPQSQPCRRAAITWERPAAPAVHGQAELLDGGLALHLDETRLRLSQDGAGLAYAGEAVPLAWLPPRLIESAGLSTLDGRADLHGRLEGTRMEVRGSLSALGLDTPDGRIAAADAALEVDARWDGAEGSFAVDLDLVAGEWLLGPLYLPPPEQPVALQARGVFSEGNLRLDPFRLDDTGRLALAGSLRAGAGGLERLEVVVRELDLGAAWPMWIESLAAGRGFEGMEAAGQVRGRLVWAESGLRELALTATDVDLVDGAGRFRMHGLDGGASFRDAAGRLESDLQWDDAGLFSVPLGAARLALATDAEGVVRLARPLELPVLDGALVVERFGWRDMGGADALMELDAEIRPVDLSALTRALGLQELGGSLSGRFPGIRYADGVLAVDGGIDLDAFSGDIRIDGLTIERPLGPLPALAADADLERLDLLEVTGAFNFGRMEGLLSGRVHGLRLLDWQPVAFDARIETLEDAPSRRISQRAVDSLSSLGSGGSAVLSGTFLRIFKDFPYERVGIACRLVNNVCHMDGVADHESGGYYIVEGRLLPRLDIIGHRRRVDWPRLLAQLIAVTAGESQVQTP